jgi:hypothetical protein
MADIGNLEESRPLDVVVHDTAFSITAMPDSLTSGGNTR